MRFAIFGTGGVGGYFGGRLAQAGEDVTFIARGLHLDAIKERGLWVESINGDFHIDMALAFDRPETVGVVDVVLVAPRGPITTAGPWTGPGGRPTPRMRTISATSSSGPPCVFTRCPMSQPRRSAASCACSARPGRSSPRVRPGSAPPCSRP